MSEAPLAADRVAALLALVDQLAAELRPSAKVRARLDSRLDKDLGLDSLARTVVVIPVVGPGHRPSQHAHPQQRPLRHAVAQCPRKARKGVHAEDCHARILNPR